MAGVKLTELTRMSKEVDIPAGVIVNGELPPLPYALPPTIGEPVTAAQASLHHVVLAVPESADTLDLAAV